MQPDLYLNNPYAVPLHCERNDLATLGQAAHVHEMALRVLAEIGLEILPEDALARMKAAGFCTQGDRVFFEPRVVEEYVAEMRCRLAQREAPGDERPARLTLSVSLYAHHLHDLEDDRITIFTPESLAEMIRLVDTYAGEGVYGAAPGYVLDEPPPLQPVTQYWLAANNARNGAYPVDPTSPDSARFIFEMAEVMGQPVHSLPVYLPTPLRLGGESYDIVMQNIERLEQIHVSSMPAPGANAPIRPLSSFVLSAAELMGALVTMRVLTGLPVFFRLSSFPFDLRASAMVFGSPENLLFHLVASDLNRFYGYPPERGAGNIHVMAKLPGAQAAAEKAAIMTAGALLGVRHFDCIGALSLDEVFSPEQLVVDCEIRDWVQRLLAGLDVREPGEEVLAEIRAGLHEGFIAQDSTLDNYQQLYWYPRLFERNFLGAWEQAGAPHFRDRVRTEVRRRLRDHHYQLDETRRRELECIYLAARAHIAAL